MAEKVAYNNLFSLVEGDRELDDDELERRRRRVADNTASFREEIVITKK